jgi:hypothetical protein
MSGVDIFSHSTNTMNVEWNLETPAQLIQDLFKRCDLHECIYTT